MCLVKQFRFFLRLSVSLLISYIYYISNLYAKNIAKIKDILKDTPSVKRA